MKPTQVDKLYKQLTPQENAALAFEALNRHDYSELDVIEDAVEKRVYKVHDYKYRSRLNGMMTLSLLYSGIYWKNRAYSAANKTDLYWIIELASMEKALTEVCTRLKVDILSVKKLAQIDDETSLIPDGYAVAERVDFFIELFTGMMQ
jgi:hypothetical protein